MQRRSVLKTGVRANTFVDAEKQNCVDTPCESGELGLGRSKTNQRANAVSVSPFSIGVKRKCEKFQK